MFDIELIDKLREPFADDEFLKNTSSLDIKVLLTNYCNAYGHNDIDSEQETFLINCYLHNNSKNSQMISVGIKSQNPDKYILQGFGIAPSDYNAQIEKSLKYVFDGVLDHIDKDVLITRISSAKKVFDEELTLGNISAYDCDWLKQYCEHVANW